MSLAAGHVIDGRYKVERLLGQGGMGAVYVAEELELGRRVAIKVLLPEAAANAEAVARFEREGRAAAGLESEHVTRIFSVGRLASGAPYIAMELLDGQDLSQVLEERGPLPAHEVVHVIIDACDALADAHARGIIHRDLKPANLFFAKRANGNVTVKVLDFGISKTTSRAGGAQSHALTGTSVLIGTPFYMSPEQIREAREVDARADIWALGVTMYELLVGRVPFTGAALADLCVAVILNVHPSITAQRPDVPPALEAIVDRCLAKEASSRFSSATELADALRALGTVKAAERKTAERAPSHFPKPSETERVSPFNAGLTINPVTTSREREWTAPKASVGLYGAAGIFLLALCATGVFVLGKLGNKSATGTDGKSSVALVTAPTVVDGGVVPAATIVPLVPAPSSTPAATPTPAKSSPRSGHERPPTVRAPRAQPAPPAVPAAPATPPPPAVRKTRRAPDGPPPINFERR